MLGIQITGIPDASGNYAYCNARLGRGPYQRTGTSQWYRVACQLSQEPPIFGSVVRLTFEIYPNIDYTGTPVLAWREFPSAGYRGELKFRSDRSAAVTATGYVKAASTRAYVRDLQNTTWLEAGLEQAATQEDDSTAQAPAYPQNYWPGGSEGGQSPAIDPLQLPGPPDYDGYAVRCGILVNGTTYETVTSIEVKCRYGPPSSRFTYMAIRLYSGSEFGIIDGPFTVTSNSDGIAEGTVPGPVVWFSSWNVEPYYSFQLPPTCSVALQGQGSVSCHVDSVTATLPNRYWLEGSQTTPPQPVIDAAFTYGLGNAVDGPTVVGFLADPVNTATGAYSRSETDLRLPGPGMPLELRRSYTSADTTTGPIGTGWTHNLAMSVSVQPSGDVRLRAENGQQLLYSRQSDGSFVPASVAWSRLRQLTSGDYELLRRDGTRALFDSAGKLMRLVDRNGRGLTVAYDAARIATVTDAAGRAATFTYNGSGLVTRVRMSDAREVTYAYTAGLLSGVTGPTGATTSYAYDAGGRLASVTDPNGNVAIRNVYAADGRVVEQTDALGNRSTFSWDPATQTATMTDARGSVWQDVYSGNVLQRRVNPLGQVESMTRDGGFNPATQTDAAGLTVTLTWDAAGHLLSRTWPYPVASTETFTYDGRGYVTSWTDRRGFTTIFAYDAVGNLIHRTDPLGDTVSFAYDPAGTGLVTSSTDARGKTTTYAYDTTGNLASVSTPAGLTMMTYDAAGNRTSLVDPRGNVAGANPADFRRTWTYDTAGRVLSQTDPFGATTAFGYDPVGNQTSRTDAKGRTTAYAYNDAGELARATAPDLSTQTFEYDSSGKLASQTDELGDVTRFTYDSAGRLATRTDAAGRVMTFTRDGAGRLTRVSDPDGASTSYQYDVAGRRTATTDPRGNRTTYGYDVAGNLVRITDALNASTGFAYDAVGRRISTANPLGQNTSYAYDAAGNLLTITNPLGQTNTYGYDDAGRLISQTNPLGHASRFGYDPAGHRTSTTTPMGFVTTFSYDGAGRLLDVVEPRGNQPGASAADYRTSYAYDPVGNLAQVTDAFGNSTAYTYDARDRRTAVIDANTRTTSYSYDAAGRLASV